MRTLEARFSWLLVNPWAMLDPLSYCVSLLISFTTLWSYQPFGHGAGPAFDPYLSRAHALMR